MRELENLKDRPVLRHPPFEEDRWLGSSRDEKASTAVCREKTGNETSREPVCEDSRTRDCIRLPSWVIPCAES